MRAVSTQDSVLLIWPASITGRRQRPDERENRAEVGDESLVGRNQLAAFPLGQGDIEAVVEPVAGLGGDFIPGCGPRG